MNKKLLLKLAQDELHRREHEVIPNVLSECFKEQLDFINDPAKRKILCLPRRSGKSTAIAIYLINIALIEPRAKLLYVNTTKGEAKNVMWHDIFETIFHRMKIQAELIDSKNEIRFDNGSIIFLHGVDATPKEMNKIRGKKYKLAVIDECQSYTQDLHQMVNQVLGPTLADANATICMIGTPGNIMGEHYWWLLNKPGSQERGWKFFTWSWKNNPHVKDNMQKHVDQMLEDNPLIVKTPWFRQEYLGEWVPLTNSRTYKSEDINYIDELPTNFLLDATFILGLDLGFYPDATTLVVGAYNKKFSDKFYVVESNKYEKHTITALAQIIKDFDKKYRFRSMYADSGAQGKHIVEEIRQIHSIPLQAADKAGKFSHQNILNSDFITQNVFIQKSANLELIKELNTLLWDEKLLRQGKYKEMDSMSNNLCDALLYCHYGSRHYWYKPKDALPANPTEEQINEDYLQKIEESLGINQSKTKLTINKPWWSEQENI